ncbi:MAG: hypothetical protein Q8914_01150 [Bacteroidota bacterium]|nr:hypothetical protein [Bacteroidota bacterium]
MKFNLIIAVVVFAAFSQSVSARAQDSLACQPQVAVGDTLLNDTAGIVQLQQNRQLMLKRDQLMDQLSQAKRQTLTGAGMTGIGILGIVFGVSDFYINATAEDGDLSEALKGLGLAGVSLVEGIAGLVIMTKNILRTQQVHKKLRSPELMFGLTSFPQLNRGPGIRNSAVPCLSFRIVL